MTLRNLVPTFGKKRVPVRYRGDNPLNILHHDLDRLFEDFFSGFEIEPFGKRDGSFSPDIEVSENDKEIKIVAELAGMDEKDIDISLTNDALTISGEKKEEKETNNGGYYLKERSYGSFARSIPIHSEIQAEKIEAHFKKGVLKITLPKSAREVKEEKKIKVKAE